jgi:hypothetical protein
VKVLVHVTRELLQQKKLSSSLYVLVTILCVLETAENNAWKADSGIT